LVVEVAAAAEPAEVGNIILLVKKDT